MTDCTDHRAAAERMLGDAILWTARPPSAASEQACLAYAAVHALLAIHDTLTAADRYATNEAKQRAAEPEWPEGFDGYRESHDWGLLTRNEKQAVIKRWLAELTDAEREAKAADARAKFAAVVERAQQAFTPEPDPLDENDHRDRLDHSGDLLVRVGHKHWHTSKHANCQWEHSYSLEDWNTSYGPLTFAPEPPPDATGDDQSASEGESGLVEGEGADDAPEAILCPECGHGIDLHAHDAPGDRCWACDDCPLAASDITRALIAEAVTKVGRRGLSTAIQT